MRVLGTVAITFLFTFALVGCQRKAEPAPEPESPPSPTVALATTLQPEPPPIPTPQAEPQAAEPPELAPEPRPALPCVEEVRQLLMPSCGPLIVIDDDGKPLREDPLLKHGDRLFPAYEVILSDPKSDAGVVCNALCTVSAIKTDRRCFLKLAAGRLTDSSSSIRRVALELLEEIGDDRDTAPVVTLLSDPDSGVRRRAARTLAKIGGWRDLEAMDAWLQNGDHLGDGDHVMKAKKCRDELEERLKKHPVPKYLTN
jgi:hypothetical protein